MRPHTFCLFTFILLSCHESAFAQENQLSGDPSAIEDARAMVETMGGLDLWKNINKLYFVHEWDFVNRLERFVEHEVLDMTGTRSHVIMDSETYHRTRVYSPEHGYWQIADGEFQQGSDEQLANALERGPFSIYRLARAIAQNNPELHINMGVIEGMPPAPALVFHYEGAEPGGWIILNSRKEPMIWATTQYQYVFGPLKRFGNVWVPDWATTSDGLVRYEMISLEASGEAPDSDFFAPPSDYNE